MLTAPAAVEPDPRCAAALALDGALLASQCPWVPPRRYGTPPAKVVRFIARDEFYHAGTHIPLDSVFPVERVLACTPRHLRQMVEAAFLRVEVLYLTPLEEI